MSIINHYLKLKKTHPEHLLFYRIGSFYELYLQDAQKAAGTLNIALTSKKFGDKEIPSCGFPAKYYRQFAIKLLENNHKIAVAEQFENSTIDKNGTLKTKIERKIDHIFSPATFIDENYTPCQENILIAIKNVKKNCHICYGNVL
jgi:DNA mismatch repair protein MutS